MKMITIVAAIRTTGQISVSGPMSSDLQGLLITTIDMVVTHFM